MESCGACGAGESIFFINSFAPGVAGAPDGLGNSTGGPVAAFETVGDVGLGSVGAFEDEEENLELRLDIHEVFRPGDVGGLDFVASLASFAVGWADVSTVSGLERLRNRLDCREDCSAGMLSAGASIDVLLLCCSPLARGDDGPGRVPGESDLSSLWVPIVGRGERERGSI